MSDYTRIERSREIRLWVVQLIVPAIGVGVYLSAKHPEVWNKIVNAPKVVVEKVKSTFKKN